MIHHLKPYPAYLESGSPWLGQIPEHWVMLRGKVLFEESRLPVRDADEIVTCFRDGQVTLRRNRRARGFMVALKEAGYQGVRKGQLVIHAMDAFAGAVGVSDSDGKCTPEYIVCNPRRPDAVPGYYAFLLRVAAQTKFIEVECPAVRERAPRFRYPDFGALRFPVPTITEQVSILRYLSYVERRIQVFIRGKTKLITHLNEQKHAIIHRAVTHGLDTSAKLHQLKSSPNFLVNAAWPIVRLWDIGKIHSEKRQPGLNLLSVFLGRGVIPYVEDGGQVHKPSLDLAKYQVVHRGDLVLNNQQAWRGSVGVSKYDGIISPAYVVIRLKDSLDSNFASYLFQSHLMVAQFVTSSKGVGSIQRDIHLPWLKNVRLPLPSREEQIAIAAHLSRDLSDIELQVSLYEREILLLREYRTRLIADVVTGKLDIREAAARLPEVEEPEPFEEGETLVEDQGECEGAGLETFFQSSLL